MLPQSKSDFPKMLYLDQNKWIDLGRAFYSRPGGEKFFEALEAINSAVKEGKLIVPYTGVHIFEMDFDHDPDRRERLIKFMVEFSKNRVLLPIITVRPWEVRNAVYEHNGRCPPIDVRQSIVKVGISHSFGVKVTASGADDALADQLHEHLYSTEFAVKYLLLRAEELEQPSLIRQMELSTLPHQEMVRSKALTDITIEQRMIAEILEHIKKSDVGTSLVSALEEFKIALNDFYHGFTDGGEFLKFFSKIPSLHILLTLTVARDQDLMRKIDKNDSRDLMALSTALPYSNIIVMEQYWAHMVRSRRLDEKYDTTVVTDLREVPKLLNECGCI